MNDLEKALPVDDQSTLYRAWEDLDSGIKNNQASKVVEANRLLLDREQRLVMQPLYAKLAATDLFLTPAAQLLGVQTPPLSLAGFGNAGEFLSLNATMNPIPGGPGFRAP
jgi:hypothetical protein